MYVPYTPAQTLPANIMWVSRINVFIWFIVCIVLTNKILMYILLINS